VTTPGIDRPLTAERHWVKNIGRLVEIKLNEDKKIVGRIVSVENDSVKIDELLVPFSDIKLAKIQVEFNRKDSR
jgi:ribosome maturation factor RimP